jgi:hypothetical protein
MNGFSTAWVVLLVAALVWLPCPALAEEAAWQPFVMPTLQAPGAAADLRAVFMGPRGQELPRVAVEGGHFVAGGKRVRFWGVNLCFGACFPPHDVADKMAARLAACGVNAIRFHHMDNRPFPDGIWDKDFKQLSPEALDRLDYLLAAMKREGLYANLNLHVSRDFSRTGGSMKREELTEYGKVVCLFDPELIDLQKTYARNLLSHANAYTGLKYAEDPVVALVEITNENSMFLTRVGWVKDELAPRFEAELALLWNDFLARKYATDDALRAAWSVGQTPRGAEMLQAADFAPDALDKVWKLQRSGGAEMAVEPAKTPEGGAAIHLAISKVSDTFWHLELRQSLLRLRKGQEYAVRFRARADKPRAITVAAQQELDPWRGLGLSRAVNLAAEWKTFAFGFVANADEANAKLAFFVGQTTGDVWLAEPSLVPGGRLGLRPDESLDKKTVRRPRTDDLATLPRTRDYLLFLAETDRRYFTAMRDYLKKDLGLKAAVTGTIVFGLPAALAQAEMDFVDAHAYWQHPHFPRRPWDARDWVIPNTAMVDEPEKSTLVSLAAERILYPDDKSPARPFTVTEYNHPAPNDYQAEGIPMVASFAAAQDWDGVFLFAYRHGGGDWDRQAARSFFDIDANPVKMVQLAAGALVFRRGDIGPLPVSVATGLAPQRMADLAARYGPWAGSILQQAEVGAPPAVRFFGRYAVVPFPFAGGRAETTQIMEETSEFALPRPTPSRPARMGGAAVDWRSAGDVLRWSAAGPASGLYAARGLRSVALVGFASGATQQVGLAEVTLLAPKFAAITLSALDGKPLEQSRRILVTAAARTENTDQKWNAARTSVADQWGRGPTLIEPVRAEIALDHAKAAKARLVALGGDGAPLADLPVEFKGNLLKLTLTGNPATLWYVLEVQP